MGDQSEKNKARTRRARERKERVRSNIAKDLLTAKYKQQILEDKKKLHDLSHAELVKLIQEGNLDDAN